MSASGLPAAGEAVLDEVTLRGMRFHALVGILPYEREVAQPLEVDVTAWVRPGEIVDYRALYAAADRVVREETLDYLERVGDAIARRVLAGEDGSRIARVRVAVRKPHVALPGPLAHAEIVVTREAVARP